MNEHDSSFWKQITNEAQILRLKAEIEQLKSLSQTVKDNFIQEQIALRKEIEKLQQDVSNEQEKVLAAKREIKAREEKFDACSEQLNFARSEFFAEKEIFEKRMLDLQKQNQALKSSETEFIAKIDSLRREHRNDAIEKDSIIRSLQCDVQVLNKEKDILMKQLEAVYTDLKDVNQLESQLNCSLEEKTVLEEELKKSSDTKRLSDIFRDELRELNHFRSQNDQLRQENEKLRKSALYIEELEEKTEVMEIEISNLKKANEYYPELKRNLEILKEEIEQWKSVTGAKNPGAVSQQIVCFNEIEQSLIKEVESLKAKCEELSKFKEEKTLHCISMGKEIETKILRVQELETQVETLSSECSLLSSECEAYKKIIDAYKRRDKVGSDEQSKLDAEIDEHRSSIANFEPENSLKADTSDEPSQKRMKCDDDSAMSGLKEFESLRNQFRIQVDSNRKILEENKTLVTRLQQFESVQTKEQNSKTTDSCSANRLFENFY